MRTDNALSLFLEDHFRKPKPVEPLPSSPSSDLADAMAFLLNQREFLNKIFSVPPDRLVGTKVRIKLPPASWRKL